MGVAKQSQLKLESGPGALSKSKPVKSGFGDEPSTMRVNMTKHNLGNIEVGKKYRMNVVAEVTGHHHDDYGHRAELKVHKIGK